MKKKKLGTEGIKKIKENKRVVRQQRHERLSFFIYGKSQNKFRIVVKNLRCERNNERRWGGLRLD